VKLILGIGETLVGRLLLVDALRMQFRNLKLRRDPECPACGTHELTALEDYEEFCGLRRAAAAGLAAPPIREITPREVAAKRARGDDFDLIDVREPHEYAIARIEGARLIPLATVSDAISTLDPNREIVVHCKAGGRSARAAQVLQNAGFHRVWNLAGGITRWSDDVDPDVVKY
jgi:adenylyltransferase/sulfurtransferase